MSTPCAAPAPSRLQRDFYREDFRAFLARFPGTADLIVTSPPYVDARDPGAYGVEKPWTPQDDRDLGDAMFAALRPGGTAFVVVGAPVRKWRKGHGTERGLEPVRWLIDLVDRVGFTCPDVLIFGRLGLPGAYGGRFRNDFEPVLWLQKPGGEPAFDKAPLDAPAVTAYGGKVATGRGASSDIISRRVASGDAAERQIKRRGTVWEYGNVGKSHSAPPAMEAAGHPAAYPRQGSRRRRCVLLASGRSRARPVLGPRHHRARVRAARAQVRGRGARAAVGGSGRRARRVACARRAVSTRTCQAHHAPSSPSRPRTTGALLYTTSRTLTS